MSPQEIQRTAYTVECLFNSLPLTDSRGRTEIEEWVVKWLCSDRNPGRYVIYHQGQLHCHADKKAASKIERSIDLPGVDSPRAIWCDRKKISVIDGATYAATGSLIMLGTTGLALGARPQDGSSSTHFEFNSNNNNNNNNNNG